MTEKRSHFFAFTHTFNQRDQASVIQELQLAGATGVNLALNYHASRDFLLRQGPALEYLPDGFHYYKPDLSRYPAGSYTPSSADHWASSEMLDSLLERAQEADFLIAAWAVFLHNSAIGRAYPDATVTNALGNHFLSELCPANPKVRGYVLGMVDDLSSRGISAIAMESLHFHGARHGEHHERFFLEMSPTTEFLFSLCFCPSCIDAFDKSGGDGKALNRKIISVLRPFLDDADPWLKMVLTKDRLAEILGEEVLQYLQLREDTLTSLYQSVSKTAHSANVKLQLVDQTPIIDFSDSAPLDSSWLVGIDNEKIQPFVDAYTPLIYRKSADEVETITRHYKEKISQEIIPILRPTYPDNLSLDGLVEKVARIRALGINEVDFYLLDTMRPRDLDWIKQSLA